MVRTEGLTIRGVSFARFSVSTLGAVLFRFWPILGDSGSESLLLEVDDPEDDVSDSPRS